MVAPLADVVVLAAGRSSRMGEPKGLVDYDGRPWLEHQLAALREHRVVLVLGEDRDQYERAMPELVRSVESLADDVAAPCRHVIVVINPAPDRGPFSSLQEGLRAVRPGERAFVLPVDVPAASAPVWTALVDALEENPEASAAIPCVGGRGGHPVLLAAGLIAELLALRPVWGTAEPRLDHELRRRLVARVPVDDSRVGLNLNTRQDWWKVPQGR
jgi:molybdenum cofactor cytidylyltransferase